MGQKLTPDVQPATADHSTEPKVHAGNVREELPKRMVVLDFREGGTACLGWLVQKNAWASSIAKIHHPD